MVDPKGATSIAEHITRFGWIAKGLLFAVIGVLGVELARRGYSGKDTDQTGALAALSDLAFGRWLVLVMGVGLMLFAAWQFWSAAVEPAESLLDIAKRIGYAGIGVTYGLLGVTALQIGLSGTKPNSSGDGLTSPDGITSRLFELPLGRLLVTLIGLTTIVIGLYHLQKGWRSNFLDDIDRGGMGQAESQGLRALGIVGFTARALMLGVAGSLFVVAAWQHDADEAAGLDQSLRTLVEAPAGRLVLGATAAGLIAAGVYDILTFSRQELGDE